MGTPLGLKYILYSYMDPLGEGILDNARLPGAFDCGMLPKHACIGFKGLGV